MGAERNTAALVMAPRCCRCGKDPGYRPVELWVVAPGGERCGASIRWCRPCAEAVGIELVDDHPPAAERKGRP